MLRLISFVSQKPETAMYGGSTTAMAAGANVWYGFTTSELSSILTAAAALVGIFVAIIGLYFSYKKHKELISRSKREIAEHQIKMENLRASLYNEQQYTQRVVERRKSRTKIDQLLNDN